MVWFSLFLHKLTIKCFLLKFVRCKDERGIWLNEDGEGFIT